MKQVKVKTKFRVEWWENGRKFVRNFGSRGQANTWLRVKHPLARHIDITPYQERSTEVIDG